MFVYSEAARGRNRIVRPSLSRATHRYSFRSLHTFSLHYIFRFIFSSPICARENARHTPPQFEHCRGLIGSYRAVMSHNGADNARDNTPSASRLSGPLSHPGHPPPPLIHRRRLLSWNQHIPANLINIIADYAAPWSQWELRAKRYQRYEAPALCALLFPISLSLSLSPSFPAERIICRRAVAHLPFTKKLLRKKEWKERNLCYLNDERRRDSLRVVIRWCGVIQEIISSELFN